MPFKPDPVQPDFEELTTSLTNSRLQSKDNALYQTIYLLIKKMGRSRDLIVNTLKKLELSLSAIAAASFLTENNETVIFRNARQLLAGIGISFDDSVPGSRTINNTFSAGYWTPLTDGNTTEAQLIYANGQAIAVNVPVPWFVQ